MRPIIQKEELRPHEEKSASDWQCLYLPLFFKSFGGPQEGFGEGPDLMWGHGPDLMWGHPPDALGPFNPSRHLIVVFPQALCLASVAGQGKPVRGTSSQAHASPLRLGRGPLPTPPLRSLAVPALMAQAAEEVGLLSGAHHPLSTGPLPV